MSTCHLTLVSCCAEKLGRIAPARELYRSQLFLKSVQWAERLGHPWMVISAEHGLIKPDSMVAPYDRSMRSMSPDERQAWTRQIARSIDALRMYHDADLMEVTLLAGEAYATWVPLVQPWCSVHQPLAGMQIGQRLQWLTHQLDHQHDLFTKDAA